MDQCKDRSLQGRENSDLDQGEKESSPVIAKRAWDGTVGTSELEGRGMLG